VRCEDFRSQTAFWRARSTTNIRRIGAKAKNSVRPIVVLTAPTARPSGARSTCRGSSQRPVERGQC
jgi:hypothetical protein